MLPCRFSDQPGRCQILRSRRETCRPGCPGGPPLFGLAPGGVCHAVCRCRRRGALLPHPFTLASSVVARGDRRSALCGTFPELRACAQLRVVPPPGGRYPPPLFRGARTFLGILANDAAARPPGGVTLSGNDSGREGNARGGGPSRTPLLLRWRTLATLRPPRSGNDHGGCAAGCEGAGTARGCQSHGVREGPPPLASSCSFEGEAATRGDEGVKTPGRWRRGGGGVRRGGRRFRRRFRHRCGRGGSGAGRRRRRRGLR